MGRAHQEGAGDGAKSDRQAQQTIDRAVFSGSEVPLREVGREVAFHAMSHGYHRNGQRA